MKPVRTISRRSFLATVAGSAAAGGAFLAVHGEAGAAQTTDSDPGDPVGRGRGGGGVTDSDPTDPRGRGRGGTRSSGTTDRDPSDPIGRGRGGSGGTSGGGGTRSGVSDSDPSDPGGNGRGNTAGRSNCSDSDPTDPGGNGRSCRSGQTGGSGGGGSGDAHQTGRRERRYEVCWVDHPSRSNAECNMQTYSEWAITWSDGRIEHDTSESARRRAEMEARGYTARWHRMIVNEW
jgi:hypothetical protein